VTKGHSFGQCIILLPEPNVPKRIVKESSSSSRCFHTAHTLFSTPQPHYYYHSPIIDINNNHRRPSTLPRIPLLAAATSSPFELVTNARSCGAISQRNPDLSDHQKHSVQLRARTPISHPHPPPHNIHTSTSTTPASPHHSHANPTVVRSLNSPNLDHQSPSVVAFAIAPRSAHQVLNSSPPYSR
jgi:hypothetical protein